MKLVSIFEANVHPDLVPAMDQLTKKIVGQIRDAGVEIIQATSPIDKPRTEYDGDNYKHNDAYRWNPSRWVARWLIGYIKVGTPYLAVYLGLDGSIVTQIQHKSTWSKEDHIGELHHGYYDNVTKFLAYVEKSLKSFIAKKPEDRLLELISRLPYQDVFYYEPPAQKVNPEGLDDEDEFGSNYGHKNAHMGIMAAVTAAAKRLKQKQPVSAADFVLTFDMSKIKLWAERAGFDISIPQVKYRGNQGYELESRMLAASRDKVYATNEDGEILQEIDLPVDMALALKRRAAQAGDKIVRMAQKQATKK